MFRGSAASHYLDCRLVIIYRCEEDAMRCAKD